MQILTRDGTYETRSANPMQPWGSTAPPPPGSIGGEFAGVHVSEKSALQQVAVYGSVGLIAEQIATLPIKQWRLVNKEPVEMPCAPVIRQPSSEITQRDFVIQGSMSMLLRGTMWGDIIGRDPRTLLPTQIKLVHPDHARRKRNQLTGAIQTRYWGQDVPPDDVTCQMALSVPEGLEGLSPIEYLRNTIGLARAQDLHAGAFYSNSAAPFGVIEVPGDLDDDEAIALKEAWLEAHQGSNRAGLPAVVTGGAKFKPITMTMADAQFLEQMKWSASMIAGVIYRVPPHMLGMTDKTTSWGAGIEQQEIGFVRNTLLIWLCRWEDWMRSWLPKGQFVTFDLSQRLRGDTLQRFSAYQMGRVMGAMNNLEIRKAEGLPIPDDPEVVAALAAFDAPLNSSPVHPPSSSGVGPGGDKAD